MPQLYVDLISQPARACAIFCKSNHLPVDLKVVNLGRGQHQQPEYLALNPLGKVPLLVDGTLHLPESAAILCYLAAKYQTPSHWCPPSSDLAARAVFDSAMHWWHTTIRIGSSQLVFHTIIAPLRGMPRNPALAANGEQVLRTALAAFESYWLAGGCKSFMTGSSICLADLMVAVHLDQLRLLVGDPSSPQLEDLLKDVPHVPAWQQRVIAACGPEVYAEVNEPLGRLVARLTQQKQQQRGSVRSSL